MRPDLEVVQMNRGEAFRTLSHGYPYHTVRWHFHPQYEIHLITETTGYYFVGDFIGEFEPGNLVLTGPNLPHNWISNIPDDQIIDTRDLVVQFTQKFMENTIELMPELSVFKVLLDESPRGLLFDTETGVAVGPLLLELLDASGARRIAQFMSIIDKLINARERRQLASHAYMPDPSGYMSSSMNKVLSYISENLTTFGKEISLAAIAEQSASAFSMAFRRHTGMTPVHYVNRLRINLACQLLTSEEHMTVTDICYEVGFNNLSNFNRQFLTLKGMPPSRFRSLHAVQFARKTANQ
ncbi:helix-turn-helix domain-containing protein [Phyllobacterium sp. OV277]|uniref:helix-turn-helix domain-containing protein n=1 Tax=Phyllobacterium sp. OV277 TaxID=1882772 RepID=UPI00087E628A|nr:helix-turn-helix domain-containing protein [Phyllobacterium sp. OV277]SDP85027.1 transcriptional regulator, AraC family [Phyllobacterium sp. OV277]